MTTLLRGILHSEHSVFMQDQRLASELYVLQTPLARHTR
jgi:hypothetical protein